MTLGDDALLDVALKCESACCAVYVARSNRGGRSLRMPDKNIGVRYPLPGIVYPPADRLRQYIESGALGERSLIEALTDAFDRHSSNRALLTCEGDVTYAELQETTDRFAAALLRDGAPAPLVYVAAATVASSRVHVGMHHASDVVAGAIVGAALGEVARHLFPIVPRASGTGPGPASPADQEQSSPTRRL